MRRPQGLKPVPFRQGISGAKALRLFSFAFGTTEVVPCYTTGLRHAEKASRALFRIGGWAGLALVVLLAAGCGHKQKTAKRLPTAPPVTQPVTPATGETSSGSNTGRIPITELPDGGVSA